MKSINANRAIIFFPKHFAYNVSIYIYNHIHSQAHRLLISVGLSGDLNYLTDARARFHPVNIPGGDKSPKSVIIRTRAQMYII